MKTVYILGAGCSSEDGIPLVNNFFPKIVELLETELKNDREIENFKNIIEFKNALFSDFNIEEFFSIIDFYISIGVNFKPKYDIKLIRYELIKLIAKTIKHSLKEDKTKSLNYRKFSNAKPLLIEVYYYKNKDKFRKEFENHYNQIFDEIANLEKPIIFHYTKFSKLIDYFKQTI